jgi:hypothetical protein
MPSHGHLSVEVNDVMPSGLILNLQCQYTRHYNSTDKLREADEGQPARHLHWAHRPEKDKGPMNHDERFGTQRSGQGHRDDLHAVTDHLF